MTDTVISGSPIDPVDQFRSAPLPAWERLGEYEDIHYDVAEGCLLYTSPSPRDS